MTHKDKKETKKMVDHFMDKPNYIIYMVSMKEDTAENWIIAKDFPHSKVLGALQLAVDKLREKLK